MSNKSNRPGRVIIEWEDGMTTSFNAGLIYAETDYQQGGTADRAKIEAQNITDLTTQSIPQNTGAR